MGREDAIFFRWTWYRGDEHEMASVELLTIMGSSSVFTLCLIVSIVFATQKRRGDAAAQKIDDQIRAL